MKFGFMKRGIAHIGVLALLVILVSLGSAVVVVQRNSEFSSEAKVARQSWEGEIKSIKTDKARCREKGLCYRLDSSGGQKYFLLSGKRVPLLGMPCREGSLGCGGGVDLSKYVGVGRVKVWGAYNKTAKPPYIYVYQVVVLGKKDNRETLSVTEFGTIEKAPIPVPIPQGEGQSVPSGMSSGVAVPGLVGSTVCKYDSTKKPICPTFRKIDKCPDGSEPIYPEIADSCGCSVGPICRSESLNPGPNKCFPRPSCLDQEPFCMIAEPEGGWCPPSPNPPVFNEYVLKTVDGRSYPLVTPIMLPCPKGKVCAEVMPRFANLDEFVGKTVLVEGIMEMGNVVSGGSQGWWPLPNGLSFSVKNVQLAVKTGTGQSFSGQLSKSDQSYADENVYVLTDAQDQSKKYLVRTSTVDLALYLSAGAVLFGGDTYAVGGRGTVVVNLTKLLEKISVGARGSARLTERQWK